MLNSKQRRGLISESVSPKQHNARVLRVTKTDKKNKEELDFIQSSTIERAVRHGMIRQDAFGNYIIPTNIRHTQFALYKFFQINQNPNALFRFLIDERIAEYINIPGQGHFVIIPKQLSNRKIKSWIHKFTGYRSINSAPKLFKEISNYLKKKEIPKIPA